MSLRCKKPILTAKDCPNLGHLYGTLTAQKPNFGQHVDFAIKPYTSFVRKPQEDFNRPFNSSECREKIPGERVRFVASFTSRNL